MWERPGKPEVARNGNEQRKRRMIEQVVRLSNLKGASAQVLRNRGAAGVDGMTVDELRDGPEVHIRSMRRSLKDHSYEAQPILGVRIPKGKGKTRRLGVPTVTDRVLQQAVSQAITPCFEREFKDHSYGFRPRKNAHQAVLEAQRNINEGDTRIVDIDLKNFFDNVEHYVLLQRIYRKVKCRDTLWLIRKWLCAPMQVGGRLVKRRKGIPRGSPLSPLLSNIMLHEPDSVLEDQGLRYVRCADDFSVYTQSKAKARQVGNELYRFLRNKLKLPVNRIKSGIRSPMNFEVPGFGFVPDYRKGQRGVYQLVTGKKAWARLKARLKRLTRKTTSISLSRRLSKLKAVTRGWVEYFRLASMHQKLKTLDAWLRNRLRYCIWHAWKKPERKRKNLIRPGIDRHQAYAWSRTRMGGWAVARSPILRTTITVDKLHKRGYQSLVEQCKQRAPQFSPLFNEPPYTRSVRTVV